MKPEDEHRKPQEGTPSPDTPDNGASPAEDAAAQEALEALRRLPQAAAPAIVRARARQAFLRGSAPQVSARLRQRSYEGDSVPIDEGQTTSAPHPAPHPHQYHEHQVPEPERSGRVIVPLNARRSNRWGPIAFAAAIVLMLVGYGAQSPHPWRVMEIVDPQNRLASRNDLAVGAAVGSGMLESPNDGEIELGLGGMLHMRLSPGTRIMLPDAPRRWNPSPMTVEVQAGELFCTTAGQHLPTTLDVFTDNLTARVTGTTFSVWRNPEGTCVCLLEGSVMVMPKDDASEAMTVPEGNKMVLFDDGRPHLVEPITDMERAKLQMLHDSARP